MKRKNKTCFYLGVCLFISFLVWTVLICFVDVRVIGPRESSVGFAALNGYIHELTGVNMPLYVITDWLGLIPIGVAFGFTVFGLLQWIKRKSLLKVDRNILTLGIFYVVVIAVYIFFEKVVINYRPTLIDGYSEASYPSSTTMLVMCVMPSAMMQLNTRVKNKTLRRCIMLAIAVFIAFMVIGRLISGVHWITDIIGGALFSSAVVSIYYAVSFSI